MEDDPWPDMSKVFESGKTVEGEIVHILDKGIILSLENEIEGIVPLSKKIKRNLKSKLSDYKVGQKINAVVMEIKPDDKKIILFVEDLGGEKYSTKEDVQQFLDSQNAPVGEKIEIPINTDEDGDENKN